MRAQRTIATPRDARLRTSEPSPSGFRSSGPEQLSASLVILSASCWYVLASSPSALMYALKMASLSSFDMSSRIWLNTLVMPSANTCAHEVR